MVEGWFRRAKPWCEPTLAVVAAVVAVGSLAAVAHRFFWWEHPFFRVRDLSVAYGAIFGVLILATLHGYRPFERVLMLGILRLAGVIAFGWYLLHFPIFKLVNGLAAGTALDSGAVKFVVSFALCIGAGVLSYLLVEKPCIQLSKRLLQRRAPIAQPA
jgi:peptidoglycan/LPS O-acetylase OafA/YrhL